MIYRSDLKTIQDYFEDISVSQSGLKLLMMDPKKYIEKEQETETKLHFTIGSAVDLALTGQDGDFETIYYVDDLENKPSETVMEFCKTIYADHSGGGFAIGELIDYQEEILELCRVNNYRKNWGDEAKFNNIVKEGSSYWNSLKAASGKTILSLDEKTQIDAVVMSLRTHQNTSREFSDLGIFTDTLYQQPIYFDYKGIPCKALMDMIRIEHDTKTIRIQDIKTTGDYVSAFPKNVRKFRYDFQAAFYTEAVSSARDLIEEKIGQSTAGYVISGFDWIVESVKYPGIPLIFTATPDLITIGKYGRASVEMDTLFTPKIYGYDEAISRHKWHTEYGFHAPKEVMEHGGRMTLDWNGIIERR